MTHAEARSWDEILASRAGEQAQAAAFVFRAEAGTSTTLTYAALDELSRRYAARLVTLETRAPVLLLYPSSPDYVIALFACLRAGVACVPAYPPASNAPARERLAALVADSTAEVALCAGAGRDRLERHRASSPALEEVRAPDTWDWLEPVEGPRAAAPRADQLALLQYTSGSTGTPRGVQLSHGNLLANSQAIAEAFATSPSSRIVSWLPLYHDMGLIGSVLQTVYSAASCTLMSPATFAKNPLQWLRAVSDTSATISGGPNFSYDLCVERFDRNAMEGVDLSSWRIAFNGAEPVSGATMDRFTETFAPFGFRAAAHTPCYGLAESSLMVTCAAAAAEPLRATHADGQDGVRVSSGRPFRADLRIVDRATRAAVPDGAVGEIWVSGPSLSEGYWGAHPDNPETFHASLPADDRRYLRTGDLGFVRNGELFVTGRVKDVVIIRGRNHYPQDLERAAEGAARAIRRNGSAAVSVPGPGGESLVMVHELDRQASTEQLERIALAVRTAVAEHHEIAVADVVLIRAGRLPRTTSGKVRRSETRARYLRGDLTPVRPAASARSPAVPTADPGEHDSAVRAALAQAVRDVCGLGLDGRSWRLSPAAVGLDSLGILRLQHEVRRTTGRSFDLETAMSRTFAAIADQLEDATRGEAGTPPAARPTVGDVEMSPNQRMIWVANELDPGSSAYLIGGAARVRRRLDPDRLQRALRSVVRRHEALRTTFRMSGGPVQTVHRTLDPDFEVVPAQHWSSTEVERAVQLAVRAPVDVERGPLLRVRVLRTGPEECTVVLAVHHLVADLWSVGLLLDELGTCYLDEAAFQRLPPAPPYRAFHQLDAVTDGEDWAFWESRFRHGPGPVVVGDGADGVTRRAGRGAGVRSVSAHAALSGESADQLRALARGHETSLYTAFMAILQVAVQRWSGAEEFVVGTPYHGRVDEGSEQTLGCFINTVPVLAVVPSGQPFGGFLDAVHREVRQSLSHGRFPLAEAARRIRLDRAAGRVPLVDVFYAYQHSDATFGRELVPFQFGRPGAVIQLGGLEWESLELPPPEPQFDLAITVGGADRGPLSIDLVAAAARFDEAAATGMLQQIVELAQRLPGTPGTRVGAALTAAHPGTGGWRAGTPPRAEPVAPLVQQFQGQVAARGASPAMVVHGDHPVTITYSELGERVSALATELLGLGIRPGDVVALRLPSGPDLALAVLAALAVGSIVAPLPGSEADGLAAATAARLGTAAVVTAPTSPDSRSGRHGLRIERRPVDGPEPRGGHGDGAYLAVEAHASGPVALELSHRGLAEGCARLSQALGLRSSSRWLSIGPADEDLRTLEALAVLGAGAALHLVDGEDVSGEPVAAHVRAARPTHIRMRPADAAQSDARRWDQDCEVVVYGLAPQAGAARRFGGLCHNAFLDALLAFAPGARTEVLDAGSRRVQRGVVGELCVPADAWIVGYRGRPDLSAERLTPDPQAVGGRLLRTGTLARRTWRGGLARAGHRSRRTLVGGRDADLGVIEQVVESHRAVAAGRAVVDLPSDRIVVYLETGLGAVPVDGLRQRLTEEVGRALRRALPEVLQPSVLLWVPWLPRTRAGAIAECHLPPAPPAAKAPVADPTATERRVSAIASDLLGGVAIARFDSLFDQGAHSLMLIQLAATIREEFKVKVPLAALFDEPTVPAIAGRIEASDIHDEGPQLVAVDRTGYQASFAPDGSLVLPAALGGRERDQVLP